MRFNEVNRNSKDDDYGTWDIDDTRRPRLTLKHLNKLRNQRNLTDADHTKQSELWRDMYGQGGGEPQ
jgi:hypothetical protein